MESTRKESAMAAFLADPANESLADRAYRILRDRLVLLDIQPGEPLVEAVLAQEIEVGRTPLREAIKRLEADHLVATYPRRGTFASSVDLTELSTISEIREALVPLAARRAAANGGGAAAADLAEALERIENLGDDEDARQLMEFDLEVHRLINRASESPHLEETLVRLDSIVTRLWCLMIDRLPSMQEHISEHVGLMRAILGRDEELAERLANEHVQHFDAAVRGVL